MTVEIMQRLVGELDHNGDRMYSEAELTKVSTGVLELAGGGRLAYIEEPFGGFYDDHTSGWVTFAVFWFAQRGAHLPGEAPGPNFYHRVFHGDGPYGVLRELRHTYWGEADNSGYIFYPNGALICDAMVKLKRWFDLD